MMLVLDTTVTCEDLGYTPPRRRGIARSRLVYDTLRREHAVPLIDRESGRITLQYADGTEIPAPHSLLAECDPPAIILHTRRRLGDTQEGFAARLGVNRATVNAWETGRFTPGVEYRRRIGRVAGIPGWAEARDDGTPSREDTARTIRDRRTGLGLTQAEFGRLVGVRCSTVSSWETGRTTPSVKHRRRIGRLAGGIPGWEE